MDAWLLSPSSPSTTLPAAVAGVQRASVAQRDQVRRQVMGLHSWGGTPWRDATGVCGCQPVCIATHDDAGWGATATTTVRGVDGISKCFHMETQAATRAATAPDALVGVARQGGPAGHVSSDASARVSAASGGQPISCVDWTEATTGSTTLTPVSGRQPPL